MLSLVGVYNLKCLTCHKGGTLNGYILASYFLWDALDAIINFTDAGYVAHGIACFTIFFLSYVRVSPFSFFVILIPLFFFFLETIYVILRYSCASMGNKYFFLEYPLVRRTSIFRRISSGLIMPSGFWIKQIVPEADFSS